MKSGGGIAIGALNDVNPVFISEGDDEVEILVIQIEVQQFQIRCIVGYGPQESEQNEKKRINSGQDYLKKLKRLMKMIWR